MTMKHIENGKNTDKKLIVAILNLLTGLVYLAVEALKYILK